MSKAIPDVLGLFAKWPEPGRVKTRLAADTSPAWAAEVAAAFLSDSVARLSEVSARRILAFAPKEREADFTQLVRTRFEFVPQCDGDLGQRMAYFFANCFSQGADRVILLGTDSPTVPLDFVRTAFEMLGSADVVLGPATDGGYYLVGGTPAMPAIFDGIAWSAPTVLAETLARIPPDTRVALLPPWYDVDSLDDWHMLRGHMAAMKRAGNVEQLPHIDKVPPWPNKS